MEQLHKSALALCILGAAAREITYGYELVRRIHTCFPQVQESTIYAILRRLWAEGALERFRQAGDGGPARKYYHITPAGRARLAAALEDWRGLVRAVDSLCGL